MRLFLLFLMVCTSALAQKKLDFSDKVNEPQIKTVVLSPDLSLEFDDLSGDRSNLYVKLIHCNYDWTQSNLQDLEFLNDYNEFTINDYQFSSGTYIPYIHYHFQVPQVKLPGNYLLIVYRDGDQEDLLLSKRIFIPDNKITLTKDDELSGLGTLNFSNQQLNFMLNYGEIEILNPLESVHVVIRQNQRWDNARFDVKPSFIREDIQQLEYRFFDQDKNFTGGNEFRFVDFRSLNFPGQNTGRLDRTEKPFHLFVAPDKSRGIDAYAQYPDMNGGFVIENQDSGEPRTNSNYVTTTFTLNTKTVEGDVYVSGAFNNWNYNDDNRMTYNAAMGAYESTILLKQGLYNYGYLVKGKTTLPDYFEGSHFETENVYEVLVYYRPFRPNADLLIGYFVLPVNPR